MLGREKPSVSDVSEVEIFVSARGKAVLGVSWWYLFFGGVGVEWGLTSGGYEMKWILCRHWDAENEMVRASLYEDRCSRLRIERFLKTQHKGYTVKCKKAR